MDPNALNMCSYGLYVVCSKKDDKLNGQISNTVFQITPDPPTIAVSINKENLTHEFIEESRVFTVSVLSTETPMTFIGMFGFRSGRDIDKFKECKYKSGKTGAPIVLDYSLAFIEAEVVDSTDVGSHTIFIARVVDSGTLAEGEPMTYAYYHQVKKGKTPKTAATYQAQEEGQAEKKKPAEGGKMQKYVCKVCGYIYDPEKGDPDSGVQPGTAFADLPDDSVCPICGASRDQFEPQS